MTHWVRLWEDMPNDPKWRVIAKRSGRSLPEVVAVFVHMLTKAGSAEHRGELCGWNDEDVSAALDMAPEHVAAIREAMQGKTLDGDRLTGWAKRQPAREDGSAERAKAWREQKKAPGTAKKRGKTQEPSGERNRTQSNAVERPEENRTDKIDSSDLTIGEQAPPRDDRKDLFARGVEVLGAGSGGLIVKLLNTKGKSVPLVRAVLEQAFASCGEDRGGARAYVGRVIAGPARDSPAAVPIKNSFFGSQLNDRQFAL